MPDGTHDRRSSNTNSDFEEVQSFAAALRRQTDDYVAKRKADAARLVSDMGDAIRNTGTNFEQQPQLRAIFDQAALGVDDLAAGISHRTVSEMYDEVHAAVRRRPTLTAIAALATGFALYRALNARAVRPVPRSRAIVPVDVTAHQTSRSARWPSRD